MDYRLTAGIVFRGKENQMTGEKILLWREGEYHYPAAYGFVPFMISYIHEDREIHPAMVIVPGGAYRNASPSEAHLPAERHSTGTGIMYLCWFIRSIFWIRRLRCSLCRIFPGPCA